MKENQHKPHYEDIEEPRKQEILEDSWEKEQMTLKGTRMNFHHISQQQHSMQGNNGVILWKCKYVVSGVLYLVKLSLKCKGWKEDILSYTRSKNVRLIKTCFYMLLEDEKSF